MTPLVLSRPASTNLSKKPPLPSVTAQFVIASDNTPTKTGFNTLGPIEGIKTDIEKPISKALQDTFGPERVGDPKHDTSNSGWLSDILMALSNGLTNFFNLLRPSESSSSPINSKAERDKQVEAKLLKEHDHGPRSPIQNPTSPERQPLIGILKTNINDSPPPLALSTAPVATTFHPGGRSPSPTGSRSSGGSTPSSGVRPRSKSPLSNVDQPIG
ncbi:MAG: hypothetical protein ISQ13_04755 [Candidatus Margulisbacteria bacterium]|nr:hypothetical protein [Candidatus Margulisiibacteriota bacterium]